MYGQEYSCGAPKGRKNMRNKKMTWKRAAVLFVSVTAILLMLRCIPLTAYAVEDCEGDECIAVRDEPLFPSPWSGLQTETKPAAPAPNPEKKQETTENPAPAKSPQPQHQMTSEVRKDAEKDFMLFQSEAESAVRHAEEPVTIRTRTWISFHRKVMQAIEEEQKDVMVQYRLKGDWYEVRIPAGYPATKLLTEDGWCGFLYLQAIFGSERITGE